MRSTTHPRRPARWLAAGTAAVVSSLTLLSGIAAAGGPPVPDLPVGDGEPGTPTISITDATVVEGTGGKTQLAFTVSLSHPTDVMVHSKITVVSGTATNGVDFTAYDLPFAFSPGTTKMGYWVPVITDNVPEPTEVFALVLGPTTNAKTGDIEAKGTIIDDDGPTDFAQPDDPGSDPQPDPGADPQPEAGDGGGTQPGGHAPVGPPSTAPGVDPTAPDGAGPRITKNERPVRPSDTDEAGDAGEASPRRHDGDDGGAPIALAGLGGAGALALVVALLRRRRRQDEQ